MALEVDLVLQCCSEGQDHVERLSTQWACATFVRPAFWIGISKAAEAVEACYPGGEGLANLPSDVVAERAGQQTANARPILPLIKPVSRLPSVLSQEQHS